MKPKIKIDNQDIIDSGSLIVDKSKQIRFNFEESNLNFKFNFIEDKENSTSRFVTEVNNIENYLEFNIYNTNSSQLIGNDDLIPMAKINMKQMYLKFRITSIGDDSADKVFYYTWYLEK